MNDPQAVSAPSVVVKKKRINSKKKGNNFEGNISNILSAALPPIKFRRSQSSGAILGGKNSKFMEHFSDDAKALFVGDVVPTNEADVFRDAGWKFKFTLECKFYRDADNIEHLFNDTRIFKWFEKAVIDSEKVKKVPLLIFKFNHTETFCSISDKDQLPINLTRVMTLTYIKDGVSKTMKMFLLKEALLDLEWWKIRQ